MNPPPRFDFLNDPRIARVSLQAADLLNRMERAALCPPKNFLTEQGHVPADSARLREVLYRLKPEIRDHDLIRWLHQLELSGAITVFHLSSGDGVLLNFASSSGITSRAQAAAGGSNGELGLSNGDEGRVIPIYSPDRGPPSPETLKKIAVVAAAASSSDSLIAGLREFFPAHDLAVEYDRYFAHRKKIGRPAIQSAFVKWMLRAEVPLAERKKKTFNPPSVAAAGVQPSPQLDLFEEVARVRFERQLAERKERKRA
jgi:hypothetical protein